MRVVMATFGTAGDVTPFVELGRVLLARGHEVEVVTDAAHRDAVEARGLAARTPIRRYDPVALTSEPRYAEPGLGPYRLWRDVFVPLVPEMFHAVRAALARPAAVVVVHPWSHGALYAARAARTPVASLAMAPVTWWSWTDPGLYSHQALPVPLRRFLMRWPVRWLLDGVFGAGLARARRELQLPPLERPFFALGREAEVAYGLWSPLLRGPAADDPRGATLCGFLRGPPAPGPLPAALEAFLAAGPAPVVVGVGSLLPPMAGALYLAARDLARAMGERVVLVGAEPGLAAPDALVVPHVPYAALFPRARAVLHHGGAGTLSEALRAGRAQVIVPFGNDQFDNADRCERLGVARSIPRPRFTPRRLEDALAWALQPSSRERAEQVAALLRAERDGAEVVAGDLEGRFGG
ncbi:MAG: glycosyltransferase [Anaeromyxobacter sp.]